MNAINPRAVIGANKPPQTPFEAVKARIEGLHLEASNFLDGEKIETAEMAQAVEKLETELKAAIKQAEEARKAEAKPFDDAKAEIQARYNELTGETKAVTGIAIRALDACKKALTPYRIKVQQEKDEAARKAREEADRIRQEAIEAHRKANEASLAEQERAAELLRQSEAAQKVANRAEKATTIKTGLRTTYSAEITDLSALAKHVWVQDPDGLRGLMQGWADRTVASFGSNAGGLTIPGVTVKTHVEAR